MDEPIELNVPLMIRVFQAKHELTATACAHAMDIGAEYFHKIKSGKQRPNLDHLRRLAKFGGLPLSELIAMGETLTTN
jgi:transcriptional regulator with XRE-family HTH domain